LWIADYKLRTTDYGLRTTDYGLRTTGFSIIKLCLQSKAGKKSCLISLGKKVDKPCSNIYHNNYNINKGAVFMFVQDLITREHILWDESKPIKLKDLVDSNADYVITEGAEWKVFSKADIFMAFIKEKTEEIYFSDVQDETITTISAMDDLSILEKIQTMTVLVLGRDKKPMGAIQGLPAIAKATMNLRREIWGNELQIDFYQRIFESIEDEIFLTDEYGFIQYMNPRAEEVCQITLKDYIGHHVKELVQEGFLSNSITMEVLDSQAKVARIMKMKSGRLILATGLPVYGKDGKITHVLSTSKDVKEINELITKVESISKQLDSKDKEIADLQERVVSHLNYVMESEQMQEVRRTVARVAPTNVSILIEGESGTGKEVVADLIYRLSARRKAPMITINCGLIPKDLLESELFGYEPGAFTGALKNGKKGKIEAANGGTIFFDEVGELPLNLQVKLLEFLQERHIVRVGGTKKIPIDTRVIAATNRNLKQMVQEGTFRGDLFYRLEVMPINLVPLKERPEDIMPLAKMFLQKFNFEYSRHKVFDIDALYTLRSYEWPGNVRELQHTIERIVVASEKDEFTGEDLKNYLERTPESTANIIYTGIMPLKEAKQNIETTLVERAYKQCGNTYDAAKLLEVNQSTVVRILQKSKKR
ncbi:MAG: sigma 54-interacting transcriptional regulator, partial [Clostridiales bacterium]